jgi:telomerase reverse transcriptase
MAGKRKRNRSGHGNERANKRQKVYGSLNGKDPVVKDALLSQYYPQVFSLREYLISKLPTASKIRRKKILSVGRKSEGEKDQSLAEFLDQTLVGVLSCKDVSPEERLQQWTSFSQRNDTSDSNIGNLSGIWQFSMSEVFIRSLFRSLECIVLATDISQIIDFTIWLLFSKARNGRVQHLLCQGFKKDFSIHRDAVVTSAIPGLVSTYPNSHVTSMKAEPWPPVLTLMGKEGEKTMIDLILDCGIFLYIENARGSYQQLCGTE